jgi:hypothetical protein
VVVLVVTVVQYSLNGRKNMRSIIFSIALLSLSMTINCEKSSYTHQPEVQDKRVASQLSEYEVFAQEYEATFGEKPSDEVWNLGKESCDSFCRVNCRD